MRIRPLSLYAATFFATFCLNNNAIFSENLSQDYEAPQQQEEAVKNTEQPFVPFTGKVTRNKVRLRLQPSFDSVVIKELTKGDMLVIVGERDEFYALQPLAEIKGYVYRTYVLDNAIEGNRVNVRLTPDTEGAIVTQLNSGDFVEGTISPLNSKWYEIKLPSSARLWVCKEYVEKIGPPTLMAQIERRRGEANQLLNDAFTASQKEMSKPFPNINLQPVLDSFSHVVNEYRDFPEQSGRARELISQLQEEYLNKKVAFLEERAQQTPGELQKKNSLLPLPEENTFLAITSSNNATPAPATPAAKEQFAPRLLWQSQEQRIFASWQRRGNEERNLSDFYNEEEQRAQTLHGIIEPYELTIKNKPGDFVLLSATHRQPLAYLYSTQVDLAEFVGRPITIQAVARPHNDFALKAYMVLSAR